jgi:hypothetical protein
MAIRGRLEKMFPFVFCGGIGDMVFFFPPFVVEFSNCVQKGKKTQERKKDALHCQTTLWESNLVA